MIKAVILAGEVPFVAVAAFAAVAFYAGQQLSITEPKVAMAERSALIFQAVLERPGANPQSLEEDVAQPVRSVIKRYADLGYVVIDSSKDDAGNYVVAAIPKGAIDISKEMSAAIKKPQTQPSTGTPTGAK